MAHPPPTVLILGARGRFGSAAVRAFADAGWQVLAQRRTAGPASPLHSNVRWLDVDVQDTAALTVQAAGAEVVVHAMNPAYTARAWREEAPGQMAAAIRTAVALRATLLFPGNVYNFGAAMPAVLHEDTPQQATTAKGAVRMALEQQLKDAATQHGLASAVVRAGDFFGSGRGNLFDRVLVPKLARGRLGYPGGLRTPTPWAYLPDLALAFVRLADRRAELEGAQRFHFAGHALSGQDWCDLMTPIAREQGWLAPGTALRIDPLPWPLLRLLGLALPSVASLVEMRYLWATPHALDNSRLQALIGAEPRTPLPQAVAQALADLGLVRAGGAHALPLSHP